MYLKRNRIPNRVNSRYPHARNDSNRHRTPSICTADLSADTKKVLSPNSLMRVRDVCIRARLDVYITSASTSSVKRMFLPAPEHLSSCVRLDLWWLRWRCMHEN